VHTIWEYLRRIWEMHVGRAYGPLSFRFITQPVVAAALAIRAGLQDARAGAPRVWLGHIYRFSSPTRTSSGRMETHSKSVRYRRHRRHDLPNHRLSPDLSWPGFDRCNHSGRAFISFATGTNEPARPTLVPQQSQVTANFRCKKRAFLNERTG
jgi:hypothetical protein